jgi:hypothetical protein
MAVELLPHRILVGRTPLTVGGRPLADDACVIGYGTAPFAREIQLHRRWSPGVWYAAENLDCTAYYPHFAANLLNRRHEMLFGVEAIACRDRLFDEFGRDGQVFIRPTGSNKQFVGRLTDLESFAEDLAPARIDRTCRVVVAEPQTIGREWRLVVIDGCVVTGSQYSDGCERSIVGGTPKAVIEFAERAIREAAWTPDPAFMIDIGECDGELRVIELNGFSTSWLYAADFRIVAARASDLALRTWRRRAGLAKSGTS